MTKKDEVVSIEGQFKELDAKIVESELKIIASIKEKAKIDVEIQELSSTILAAMSKEPEKYPTKEAAEQELIARLNSNKSYVDSVSAISQLNEEIQMLQISIDSCKRQFSSLKALCYREVKE